MAKRSLEVAHVFLSPFLLFSDQELGLSCAEELFDAHFFHEDPGPFYSFARQVCEE